MAKVIDSDIILGNLIIEAVENGCFNLSVAKIFNCVDLLSQRLKSQGYYASISLEEMLNFAVDYPFFVKFVDSSSVIVQKPDDIQDFLAKLKRYFRIGNPTCVISAVKDVYSEVSGGDKRDSV